MPARPRYTDSQVEAAVRDVKLGKPVREAARLHGVPKTTLHFRLSDKFTKSRPGPASYLSVDEETVLVNWLIDCMKAGFPRSSLDLRLSVKEFLDDNPRENPFTDNHPGRGWLKAFFKRHPQLTQRKPEAVTRASACVSEEDIRGWFTNVEEVLRQKEVFNVLSSPERVFNGDEIGFGLCPQKNLVIALRGAKNVYDVDGGEPKASVTTLFTFSADGGTVPPMLVYPYQRIPAEVSQMVPRGWFIGKSESGWMTSEVFYEYIGNCFNSHLIQNKIQRPVILFMDGHKTHLTRQVSLLCAELQIILIALYPNTTRILQPCDVALFHPIKSGWNKAVAAWRMKNPLEAVTKSHVAPILATVLDSKDLKTTCQNGFRVTGLCPWNPDAVDYSKCLGKREENKELPASPEDAEKKTLSFETFCEIIGDEKVKICKAMQEQREEAPDNVVYKLWMAFHDQKRDSEGPQPERAEKESHPAKAAEESQTQEAASELENVSGQSQTEEATREHENDSDDSGVDDPPPVVRTPTPKPLQDHLFWPEAPKRKGRRQKKIDLRGFSEFVPRTYLT
ncbi:hypothetical protein FOCC_FOCC003569 [Frankliniella occidentalis]|nr:hypothetical protein FOCC_FOCC003569 [Frankliniella occidentalis]